MYIYNEVPLAVEDGLITSARNLYHPAIFYNCTGGLQQQLASPSRFSEHHIFEEASRAVAQDVVAAGDNWTMMSGLLRRTADVAALQSKRVEQALVDAAEFGERFPREWILVARSFVFEAGKNQFVHIASGGALSPETFDMEFGCICPSPGQSFARFLCNGRYIVKVQEVVEEGECSTRFFLDRGRLKLSLATCPCVLDVPLPLLHHLEP